MDACDAMKNLNLRFIGPVKTATKGFCNEYLKKLELHNRSEYFGVYTIDNDGKLDKFGFTWMDCMQFVSNTSSTYLGNPFVRNVCGKSIKRLTHYPSTLSLISTNLKLAVHITCATERSIAIIVRGSKCSNLKRKLK